jgi:outer membrane protein W
MFPASKSASALDTNSISTTTVFLVQAGFDYFLNKNMFIPFSVEYGMLPKSNEVDASWMELRVGLGIPF